MLRIFDMEVLPTLVLSLPLVGDLFQTPRQLSNASLPQNQAGARHRFYQLSLPKPHPLRFYPMRSADTVRDLSDNQFAEVALPQLKLQSVRYRSGLHHNQKSTQFHHFPSPTDRLTWSVGWCLSGHSDVFKFCFFSRPF